MSMESRLVPIAVAAALLAGCSTHGESDASAPEVSERAPITYEMPEGLELDYNEPLPELTSDLWDTFEDDSGMYSIRTLASYDLESGTLQAHEDLPQIYVEAMEMAVQSPIMQYAIRKGYVSSVVFRTARSDNGFFGNSIDGEGEIGFDVSRGDGDRRLYSHVGIFTDVAGHEAGHAIAHRWYEAISYGGEGVDSLPPSLSGPISRSLDICSSIRADVLANFMAEHGSELASTYRSAAADFIARAEDGDRPERMRNIAEVLTSTAAAVEAGETYEEGYEGDTTCRMIYPIEFPYLEAERLDRVNQIGEYNYEEPAEQIRPFGDWMRERLETRYTCIKDSNAVADRLGIDTDRPGGHAFSNLTEFYASFIAILQTNPSYMQRCLMGLPANDADPMAELMRLNLEIMEATEPELVEIIEDMGAAQKETLNWIRTL